MKRWLAGVLVGLGAGLVGPFLPGVLVFPGQSVAQPKEAAAIPKVGTHVEWEGWTFNWAVRSREGLVLTDVFFRGHKVLKYAGLAELFTAYDQGQPRPQDFNQGYRILHMVPGVDCSSGEWCKVFDGKGRETAKSNPPR